MRTRCALLLFGFLAVLVPACAVTAVGASRTTTSSGYDAMTADCNAACVDRAADGACVRFTEDMARVCLKYVRAAKVPRR